MKQKTDSQVKFELIHSLLRANPSPERRKRLRQQASVFCGYDALELNAQLKTEIESLQKDGKLAVYRWGRDCDLCESDSVTLIPASVMAYRKFERHEYRWAEGPTTVRPISFEEYADFEPSFRDHLAERYNY